VFRSDIFRYIQAGEELVYEPFQRLIKEGKLYSYRYEGFWISMDTFKDKQRLDDMHAKGETPWAVWS
jgi:glucose-1-phosphate cytidylyltransferase